MNKKNQQKLQITKEIVEEYIVMRNNNIYDIRWFYSYYLSKTTIEINMQQFSMVFATGNIEIIIEHLDFKFGLTRLYDRNNNFIKIVV